MNLSTKFPGKNSSECFLQAKFIQLSREMTINKANAHFRSGSLKIFKGRGLSQTSFAVGVSKNKITLQVQMTKHFEIKRGFL